MKLKFLYLFLILHLLLLNSEIKAQVTIGSPEQSLAGAVLQLKNIENVTDGSANANRGLGLPRVNLQQANSLQPCADELQGDNAQNHVGLIVYNLYADHYFCPGAYVWDGTEWVALKQTASPSSGSASVSGDAISNSFIIPPNSNIEIPITKAFDVWENTANLAHGTDYLSTDAEDISVEFMWQDEKGLFRHVEIIRDNANPRNSRIKLVAGCPSAIARQGNAIVAVKIKKKDKTEDEIRWSWHVWVSNYNPNASVNNFNSRVWMDRNLGATNIIPGDLGSTGLYYQWGRKDPFPGVKDWEPKAGKIFHKKDIYLVTNEPTVNDNLGATTDNEIESAIKKPRTFFTGVVGNSPNAWYTKDKTILMPGLWGSLNNNPGTKGPKTIYDPCPAGWRVPVRIGYVNVWIGLEKGDVTWMYNADNTRVVGCYWPGAGFLPFTGDWYPSGALMHVATSINTWTGTMHNPGFAQSSRMSKKPDSNDFEESGGFSTGDVGQNPVHGYSVRCIKDE